MTEKEILQKARLKKNPEDVAGMLLHFTEKTLGERIAEQTKEFYAKLKEKLAEFTDDLVAVKDKLKKDITQELKDFTAEQKARTDIRGDRGEPGADGYTPVKGKDYFDGKNGSDGSDGENGKDAVVDYIKIKAEVIKAIGSVKDTPNQVVDKVNSASKKVSMLSILGLKEELASIRQLLRERKSKRNQISGGGSLNITAGTNISITGDGTSATPYVVNSTAAGATWGGVLGTLSDQTDLQDALDLKADTSDLASYVPYTGATTNVNLGAHDLLIDTNLFSVDSTDNMVGVGIASPEYSLDVRNAGTGAFPTVTLHLGDTDNGAYLQTVTVAGDLAMNGGAMFDGTNWVAKHTAASRVDISSGQVSVFTDSGLTPGNTFTPTNRMKVTTAGDVAIGAITPSAYLHIKAGTATAGDAPIKLSSGTLLTAPEAGAIEFLDDNFYMTQTTSTVRQNVAFVSDSNNILANQVFL